MTFYNMQYLRNHWSDFKTITMKITIFIIVLVLKSNETWKFDISDCHSLLTVQNPAKTVYLKTFISKCSPPAFMQSFDKAEYGLVDGVLWQIIPYCLQDFLQLVNGIWLGLKCLLALKSSSPDMIIKRINVW